MRRTNRKGGRWPETAAQDKKRKKEEQGVLVTDGMLGQVYTIHVNIKTVTAMQLDRRE